MYEWSHAFVRACVLTVPVLMMLDSPAYTLELTCVYPGVHVWLNQHVYTVRHSCPNAARECAHKRTYTRACVHRKTCPYTQAGYHGLGRGPAVYAGSGGASVQLVPRAGRDSGRRRAGPDE